LDGSATGNHPREAEGTDPQGHHLEPNALADAVRILAPKLELGDAPKVAILNIAGGAK
jgi:hypothetical protein